MIAATGMYTYYSSTQSNGIYLCCWHRELGATTKKYTWATSFVFKWIFHMDNQPRTIIRFTREEPLFICMKTTVIS